MLSLSQGHTSSVSHLDWSTDGEKLQSTSRDYELLFCKDCCWFTIYYLKRVKLTFEWFNEIHFELLLLPYTSPQWPPLPLQPLLLLLLLLTIPLLLLLLLSLPLSIPWSSTLLIPLSLTIPLSSWLLLVIDIVTVIDTVIVTVINAVIVIDTVIVVVAVIGSY